MYKRQIMIWPERPGSWRNGAKEAETAFSAVIRAIAASETVYVAAGKKGIDHAKAFAESLKKEENLHPVVVFEKMCIRDRVYLGKPEFPGVWKGKDDDV